VLVKFEMALAKNVDHDMIGEEMQNYIDEDYGHRISRDPR